jgi:N-methylhydantoinase A/oxoprolinase/acetone carboxylase beta subunit
LSSQRRLPDRLDVAGGSAADASRSCYFCPAYGWIEATIVSRASLRGRTILGPAIIEEESSATVLNPGWAATLDDRHNIVATPTSARGEP